MELTMEKTIKSEIITITPDMAKKWLKEKNHHNRIINKPNVTFLKNQILEGSWEPDADSIDFSERGHLLDGQHTLHAIIEANIPVERLVIYNKKESSKNVMNTGKMRSFTDVITLNFRDVKYAHNIASAVSFTLSYDRDAISGMMYGSKRDKKPNNVHVVNFLKETPEFFGFIEDTMKLYHNSDKLVTAKLFCGLKWLCDQANKEKSDSFFHKLAIGTGIDDGDPVGALRNLIIRQKTGTVVYVPIKNREWPRIVIYAWNAYMKDEQIKRFSYKNKKWENILGRPPKSLEETKD